MTVIENERDDALAELKILRGASLAYIEALEEWWMRPNDVTAKVAQYKSVAFYEARAPTMSRVFHLYERGIIVERPGFDLTEPHNG